MRTAAAALAMAGALTLSACGSSPPTHFYVLAPIAPASPAQASSAPATPAQAAGAPIRVAAVHLPEELDRLEMVSALGPNRLAIRGEDRWAAPLDDMTRRVLTQDLQQRLPAGRIAPARAAAGSTHALVVDLQSFGVDAAGAGRLQGSWSLYGPERKPVVRREVDLTEPGAAAPQGQAAVMSRLLASLADQIAAAVGQAGGQG